MINFSKRKDWKPNPQFPDPNEGWFLKGPVDELKEGEEVIVSTRLAEKPVICGKLFGKTWTNSFEKTLDGDPNPNYGKEMSCAEFIDPAKTAPVRMAKCPKCGYEESAASSLERTKEEIAATSDMDDHDDIPF